MNFLETISCEIYGVGKPNGRTVTIFEFETQENSTIRVIEATNLRKAIDLAMTQIKMKS